MYCVEFDALHRAVRDAFDYHILAAPCDIRPLAGCVLITFV